MSGLLKVFQFLFKKDVRSASATCYVVVLGTAIGSPIVLNMNLTTNYDVINYWQEINLFIQNYNSITPYYEFILHEGKVLDFYVPKTQFINIALSSYNINPLYTI